MDLNVLVHCAIYFICIYVLFCVHLWVIRIYLCCLLYALCHFDHVAKVPKRILKIESKINYICCLFACMLYLYLCVYKCIVFFCCDIFLTCQCVSMSHTPKTDLTAIENVVCNVYVHTQKIHDNLMLN